VKLLALSFSLLPNLAVSAQPSKPEKAEGSCSGKIADMRFECPAGWNIVDQGSNSITGDTSTTIGDFKRGAESRLTRPAGRATIKIGTKPKFYRDVQEWVHVAGTKHAPESIPSTEQFSNKFVGSVEAICLSSPPSSDFFYASYFLVVKGTPLIVELVHNRDSSRAGEYRRTVQEVIEHLQPIR